MHFVLIFLSSLLIGYLLILTAKDKSFSENNIVIDSTSTITFAFVGDLMCHTPQITAAKTEFGKYNFEPVFEYVKEYLSNADFTAGNLETTIGDSKDSFTGYPNFRSPPEYLIALKNSGFDLLFTANNHSLDYGEKGVIKTISHLKQNNLNYTGTFESFSDYDSLRILQIKDFKVAFLAASYGTNGMPIPIGKNYLINLINIDSLRKQISKAKEKGVDLIVINVHFGEEYSTKPNAFQKMVVDSLIAFGADLIIGNHPHVLQPTEIRKSINSKIDSVVIAYSLGNFISNQRKFLTAIGAILLISVEKDFKTYSVKLKNIEVVPTYVYKDKINGKLDYRIIPVTKEMLERDSHQFELLDKKFLQSVFNEAEKIGIFQR